jgi:hypothetical protein
LQKKERRANQNAQQRRFDNEPHGRTRVRGWVARGGGYRDRWSYRGCHGNSLTRLCSA